MEKSGGKIEDLLTSDPPLHKEAWRQMKGWYKIMAVRASNPARLTIKRIIAERVALHHHIPPIGEKLPIYVDPLPLDDSVPIEDNIEWAV